MCVMVYIYIYIIDDDDGGGDDGTCDGCKMVCDAKQLVFFHVVC